MMSKPKLLSTLESLYNSPTMKLIKQIQESPAAQLAKQFQESQSMQLIKQIQESPAAQLAKQFQESQSMQFIKQIQESPAAQLAKQFQESQSMQLIKQMQESPAAQLAKQFHESYFAKELNKIKLVNRRALNFAYSTPTSSAFNKSFQQIAEQQYKLLRNRDWNDTIHSIINDIDVEAKEEITDQDVFEASEILEKNIEQLSHPPTLGIDVTKNFDNIFLSILNIANQLSDLENEIEGHKTSVLSKNVKWILVVIIIPFLLNIASNILITTETEFNNIYISTTHYHNISPNNYHTNLKFARELIGKSNKTSTLRVVAVKNYLHVRVRPSISNSRIIGTLLPYSIVSVKKKRKGWRFVTYFDSDSGIQISGWVSSKFLKKGK